MKFLVMTELSHGGVQQIGDALTGSLDNYDLACRTAEQHIRDHPDDVVCVYKRVVVYRPKSGYERIQED